MRSDPCVELRAELRAPSGKLLRRLPWVRANSLLSQFIQFLCVQMEQAARNIRATDNSIQNPSPNSANLRMDAAVGVTARGILIGTGTNPVTMTDYKLQTQVTTNIAHGATIFAVENPDANTWRIALSRAFTNNTGATLAIREVGMYTTDGGGVKFYCIERTLYSLDVPNGLSVTFVYRITITL